MSSTATKQLQTDLSERNHLCSSSDSCLLGRTEVRITITLWVALHWLVNGMVLQLYMTDRLASITTWYIFLAAAMSANALDGYDWLVSGESTSFWVCFNLIWTQQLPEYSIHLSDIGWQEKRAPMIPKGSLLEQVKKENQESNWLTPDHLENNH